MYNFKIIFLEIETFLEFSIIKFMKSDKKYEHR